MKKSLGKTSPIILLCALILIALMSVYYFFYREEQVAVADLQKKAIEHTNGSLRYIRNMFEVYHEKHGRFPTNDDELTSFLKRFVSDDNQYLNMRIDSWGNRFRIFSTSRYYLIQSFGENGQDNHGCLDDIVYVGSEDTEGSEGIIHNGSSGDTILNSGKRDRKDSDKSGKEPREKGDDKKNGGK